jgi:cytochrome c-type biogenesis protein CcmF
VRSGVLTSVHSFATDPGRGLFILLLLLVAIGGSLTLYAVRAPALKGGGLFAPISREGGLVLNNLLLATAAGTVFLGTLYPLFVDALELGKVSVGKPYFDATFVPLMVPVLVVMAAGPMLAWKRADLRAVVQRLGFAFAAALIAAAVTWYLTFGGPVLALLGIGLTAWILGAVLTDLAERIRLFRLPLGASLRRARGLPRSAWGTALAHAGVGIVVAGITGSSAWQAEKILTMRIGDSAEVAGYSFTLDSVEPGEGPNYALERGSFSVTRDGAPVVRLTPERRFYPVQQRQTTEAAIHSNGLADLYAVLGDGNAETGWTVRLYHNPLIPWLWAGVVIMVAGGLLSLSDRRFRIGAPTRARRPVRAAAPAAAGD